MNYSILVSLLCATAIHAADQKSNSTKVYVCIKDTAPFKSKADPRQDVWDVAHEIAKKHNLTVTGLHYYQRNGQIQGIPSHINYPLQWHLTHHLPLHISAKHNPHTCSPNATRFGSS